MGRYHTLPNNYVFWLKKIFSKFSNLKSFSDVISFHWINSILFMRLITKPRVLLMRLSFSSKYVSWQHHSTPGGCINIIIMTPQVFLIEFTKRFTLLSTSSGRNSSLDLFFIFLCLNPQSRPYRLASSLPNWYGSDNFF